MKHNRVTWMDRNECKRQRDVRHGSDSGMDLAYWAHIHDEGTEMKTWNEGTASYAFWTRLDSSRTGCSWLLKKCSAVKDMGWNVGSGGLNTILTFPWRWRLFRMVSRTSASVSFCTDKQIYRKNVWCLFTLIRICCHMNLRQNGSLGVDAISQ